MALLDELLLKVLRVLLVLLNELGVLVLNLLDLQFIRGKQRLTDAGGAIGSDLFALGCDLLLFSQNGTGLLCVDLPKGGGLLLIHGVGAAVGVAVGTGVGAAPASAPGAGSVGQLGLPGLRGWRNATCGFIGGEPRKPATKTLAGLCSTC